ncbi:tyrosine-type recombinase/integrase [Clostridium aminobutyricum]|uniref:Site-specific integrase n=1 Tax=Clostridium aminobutyricum TaxID=33953 RepID=A0A939D9F0_CLOAM|nr:tyrosine-type recombinase/integrase [Clostridium aminobutyricum]MBN7773641.1 site-specific integrase [Clostridium aminobutyricum]
MPRRGENVYKRKDGRWEGRILKSEGKYQYVYAKTYKEVKEKMKNYKEHLKIRERKLPAQTTSAAELFEVWLNSDISKQVKPSTYENYYSCIKKYVIPFFRDSGTDRITELSVAKFVKSIKDNGSLAESYKRKILTIFKTALKEVLKGSERYAAVMEVVKMPKTKNSNVQVFSINEQRLIENTALRAEDRRALGILLCFYTGIRLGELCALKWCDIDFEAGTMSVMRTVSRTKNFQQEKNKTVLLVGTPKSHKSARKIPLPDFLLKLSEQFKLRVEEENCYILSGSSMPIDPRTYQKLYKKILVTAGVKDHKFHAIRHTFATRALELGVDIKTLSEILGHSNVSITLNIYAHSLMEQKKIAMDKLNSMHITHMKAASFVVADSVASV